MYRMLCKQIASAHPLFSLARISCASLLLLLWEPFLSSPRLPLAPSRARTRPCPPRTLFVVSTLFPIHRFTFSRPGAEGGRGRGERLTQHRRALFIQLPYLNVALTRRKIICKNPHKICKSPLMHREIVALCRRAYGIIIPPGAFISRYRSLVAKKGGRTVVCEIQLGFFVRLVLRFVTRR